MGLTSRDEIERLKRDANLLEYACARARYEVDLKESSPRGNLTHWIPRRATDGSKILVLRGPKCWLYFDLRDHGQELGAGGISAGNHGTIIDFVQQELGLPRGRGTPSFGLALTEIRDFVGGLPSPPLRPTPVRPGSADSLRVPDPEVQERWNAAREMSCSAYLASRALTPATLSDPRFRGVWRIDRRQNLLFAHRDANQRLVGFEIKNHNFTSYPRGGVRTGMWRSNALPGDRYLLLTESAINALSFHQLHPQLPVSYRSFGGRIGAAQLQLLQRELEKLPATTTVLLAFDGAGDRAGQHYEHQVQRVLPAHLRAEVRHPPHSKDWNDYVQALEFDR